MTFVSFGLYDNSLLSFPVPFYFACLLRMSTSGVARGHRYVQAHASNPYPVGSWELSRAEKMEGRVTVVVGPNVVVNNHIQCCV